MIVIMGPKPDFTSNEKSTIVSELENEKTTIKISKIQRRDHRTVKTFEQSPISVRSREDKSNWSVASNCTLSRVKREVVRNLCPTCRELFKRVGRKNVSKTSRCRLLKQVAKNVKLVTRPL